MAWQRNIPFGYRMEQGNIIPHPDEAEAVRRMFGCYIAGDSYQSIADTMSRSGLRYHEAKQDWNKHMVKRILENARYTGADGWPEIVPPDVFHGAARLRESKTDGWYPHPDCNDAVKRKLTCAACGTPYRVKTSSRDGVRWWHCGNDNCGGMLKMRDSELERSVTVLLNILIAKPELLEMPHIPAPLSFESERIQNELYRELGKPDWNVDYAKTLAFARAAEIYDALGNDEIIRQNAVVLQNRISLMKPLTAFDRELFCAAVDTVLAGADGSLALKLISGSIIENTQGKEEHNADTDATATT